MSSEEGGSDRGGGGRPTSPSGPESYFREKPVKVGDELEVTISEISRRGDGVARVRGYVIFVPNGKQGQQARIRVTTIRPNFGIAEIIGGGGSQQEPPAQQSPP